MAFQPASVDPSAAGMRLDVFVARHFRAAAEHYGLSRSRIQQLIDEGLVVVNGVRSKPSTRLKLKDTVELKEIPFRDSNLAAEAVPLRIIHEDNDCVLINKSPGMVVHPAAGWWSGTLVNALLHHCPELMGMGLGERPGIVHRLDKETSGIMVIAKNDGALRSLAHQFKSRTVHKDYLAVVWGRLDKASGVVNRPIGRHRSQRKRMSSLHAQPRTREAITRWNLERSFDLVRGGSNGWLSLLRVSPGTGRTHQIRVHMADMGYPLVGDKIYGSRVQPKSNFPVLSSFPRQALHAERLSFDHPDSGRRMTFTAPLWEDMERLLEELTMGGLSGIGVDKKFSFK